MIVIIDYGMGNLASVEKAINKIGRDVIISDDVNIISKASIIILPGVGSFEQGMKNLIQRNLVNVLSNEVIKKKKPWIIMNFQPLVNYQLIHQNHVKVLKIYL